MKLEVRHRTRSAAHRFPSHPDDEAQQSFRPGIIPENLRSLRFDGGASDFDDARIIRAVIDGHTAQQSSIHRTCRFLCEGVWRLLCEISNGWVILELHRQPSLLHLPEVKMPFADIGPGALASQLAI
jgi:hypothetical protein